MMIWWYEWMICYDVMLWYDFIDLISFSCESVLKVSFLGSSGWPVAVAPCFLHCGFIFKLRNRIQDQWSPFSWNCWTSWWLVASHCWSSWRSRWGSMRSAAGSHHCSATWLYKNKDCSLGLGFSKKLQLPRRVALCVVFGIWDVAI